MDQNCCIHPGIIEDVKSLSNKKIEKVQNITNSKKKEVKAIFILIIFLFRNLGIGYWV